MMRCSSRPANSRMTIPNENVSFSKLCRNSLIKKYTVADGETGIGANLVKANLKDEALLTNWAETVVVGLEQFRYPETIDDVVELVKTNEMIRCSGALHSCAPLISSQGIILSLKKLDKIISIDPGTRIVRMQAGVRMHDLCNYLSEYDLAVGTLGTIDWQTICGAVMTGTHGGGLTIPSLHDFVRSYTIVLPDGTLKRVDKEGSPTLFRAMAPSMGLFGAVVEMEMEAVPLEILEAKMVSVPIDEVIPCFDSVMKSNKYTRVIVYPSINKATIWTANPVASREAAIADGATNNYGYTNFRNEEEKSMLEDFLVLCNKNEFEEADRVLERVLEMQLQRLKHYVGQYNHVLCLERNNGIPHADIEMNFSYHKHKEVLQTVFNYCHGHRLPYYNFEIRTTNQDDAFLSCCQSRPGLWIDFQAKAHISKRFFQDMKSLLKQHGFRKHWAKGMDNSDPNYVIQQFPDIGKFIKEVKAIDPAGKFRNEEGKLWFEALDLLTKDCAEDAKGGSDLTTKDRLDDTNEVSGPDVLLDRLVFNEQKHVAEVKELLNMGNLKIPLREMVFEDAKRFANQDGLNKNEPVPIVLISDPGQDLDDEMMFIMSTYFSSLGLVSIRGVIANLHPSLARARLTRGTFDLLGMHDVPVGIGTDGGDTSGMHSSEQFESTASAYIIHEEDEAAMQGLEDGYQLLQRLYQAAPDIEYVNPVEEGANGEPLKNFMKGGLTIVVTSSFKDISIFVRENRELFASKTREVVVMGGCEPVAEDNGECKPDSAQNNMFDPEASAYFYSQCQKMNITLTIVARHSAYAAKMPRSVYDDLALTGSAIGMRLRDSQRAGIDQLWQRASSADPRGRKGLPPRCDRKWFINTFCGGTDDPSRSGDDSVWDLVTGFMQYDTLALMASIPVVRDMYFDPTVLPPLHKNIGVARAFHAGTRNLIGINEKEHNLKDPSLLVQLLKTGYRQGILCNQTSEEEIEQGNDVWGLDCV